jgi:hypothetical protein
MNQQIAALLLAAMIFVLGVFVLGDILRNRPNDGILKEKPTATVHILTDDGIRYEGVVGTTSKHRQIEGTKPTIYRVIYGPSDTVIANINKAFDKQGQTDPGTLEVFIIANDRIVARDWTAATGGYITLEWRPGK